MAKSTCSLSSAVSSISPISPLSTSSSSSSSTSNSNRYSSSSRSGSSQRSLGLKSSATCSAIDRRKRLAANARERKRMHLLNRAYDELRLKLIDAGNKSKYDVLVQAKEYIQALASICENFDHQQKASANNQQACQINCAPESAPAPATQPQHLSLQASNIKPPKMPRRSAPELVGQFDNQHQVSLVDLKPTAMELLHYQRQQGNSAR